MALFSPAFESAANDYQSDSHRRNDLAAGCSGTLAWRPVEKVCATVFAPDDHQLFRAGGVRSGQRRVTAQETPGRPIQFSATGVSSQNAATHNQVRIWSSDLLPFGPHKFRLVVRGDWIELDYLRVADDPLPPTLTIRREDKDVVISWEGSGALQSAPHVNGPYTTVEGATNPHVTKPEQTARYYRVRQ